ncbi:reverse transcriptase domain-containing protein [Tanacetum coccineum]|uniref:Reverse transcriptase domain-containing protein n=1 Tax=Tanacetum coccineum TaxID=301880 RepID=A0ABQ5D331_9ASTR
MVNMSNNSRSKRAFETGDWVYVKLQPHRQLLVRQGVHHKLSTKYFGPFQVIGKIVEVAYKLQLPNTSLVHHVFYVSQLKKCHGQTVMEGVLTRCEDDGRLVVEPDQKMLLGKLIMSLWQGFLKLLDTNLRTRTICKVRVPETSGKLCMSLCGWLLTTGNDCAAKLIHPLSKEIINLLKIDTFPKFLEDSEWDRGCSGKLGICHPRDNNWIDVEAWRRSIFDITYQNGLVYCFDVHNPILAYDVDSKNPETTMVDITWLTRDLYDEWVPIAYIIEGLEENNLLVVIRETKVKIVNDKLCKSTYKTKSFREFKYDLESKGSERWSVLKDLGRGDLFVGYNVLFWMEEDPARVINGNYIYYTDDDPVLYRGSIKGGGRDMGIYHMYNGTIESHYTGEPRSHHTPPIWVQPK